MAKELRNHATTVLVMRDGKVLLVQGSSGRLREFAIPGGGIEEEEFPIVAAASELHEETGLNANRIEYLLTYKSSIHNHVVFSMRPTASSFPDLRSESTCGGTGRSRYRHSPTSTVSSVRSSERTRRTMMRDTRQVRPILDRL